MTNGEAFLGPSLIDFDLLLTKIHQGSKHPKVTSTSHLISRRNVSKALFRWATAKSNTIIPTLFSIMVSLKYSHIHPKNDARNNKNRRRDRDQTNQP